MSFPPPPGLSQSSQSHSSLPPRPPPSSTVSAPAGRGRGDTKAPGTTYNAFTAFQPRAVAATKSYHAPSSASPTPVGTSAGFSTPTTTYSSGYQYPGQQASYQHPASSYYGQQQQYGDASYSQSNTPQIRNPFPLPGQEPNAGSYGTHRRGFDSSHDPEMEAQIAQWQSAYMSKDSEATAPTGTRGGGTRRDGTFSATGANTGPLGSVARHESSAPSSSGPTTSSTPVPGAADSTDPSAPQKTVFRSGGGQTWSDSTLLEWDPAHFRLFVGNLAGEVTDESLIKAFSKYSSVQKARVVRDKRTEKSKGYGFVSFSDGDDYFKAAREMQGKYIGSHPVLLKRAMTDIRPATNTRGGGRGGKKGGKGGGASGAGGGKGSGGGGGGGGGSGAGGDKVIGGGVQKKQGKTKGGLKVLG